MNSQNHYVVLFIYKVIFSKTQFLLISSKQLCLKLKLVKNNKPESKILDIEKAEGTCRKSNLKDPFFLTFSGFLDIKGGATGNVTVNIIVTISVQTVKSL